MPAKRKPFRARTTRPRFFRIEIRVSRQEKEQIQASAEKCGKSLSDFVMNAVKNDPYFLNEGYGEEQGQE